MANEPQYIYPQWLNAKRQLIDTLKLDSIQAHILEGWFRAHLFEFCISCSISKDLYGISLSDAEKEIEYKMMRKLSEQIFKKGMFYEERFEDLFSLKIRRTILIAGCADVIGPEEHFEV